MTNTVSYYSLRQEFEMKGQFEQWEHWLISKGAKEQRISEEAPQVLSNCDKDWKMQPLDNSAITFLTRIHLPSQWGTYRYPLKLQNTR